MAKASGKDFSIRGVIGWLVGAFIGFVIFCIIMEWLGSSGYAEKLLIKMVKEIPYGQWIGQVAGTLMKNVIGTSQDMAFYSDKPITFARFIGDLLKLILSGLFFKALDKGMEFLAGVEGKVNRKGLIIKGAIKFICAMIATSVSAIAYSAINKAIEFHESGIWNLMNSGEQIKIVLLEVASVAAVIGLIVLGTFLIYKTFNLAILLWNVVGKMLIVNIFSLTATYFVMFFVVEGIALRLPPLTMLVYLIIVLILIVVLTGIDWLVERAKPII